MFRALCFLGTVLSVFAAEYNNEETYNTTASAERRIFGFDPTAQVKAACYEKLYATGTDTLYGFTPYPLIKLSNNHVYYVGYMYPVTFESAANYCKEHGMHLLTINSAEENVVVFNFLYRYDLIGTSAGVWIGIRDASSTGDWRYIDTNAPANVYFGAAAATKGQCIRYISGKVVTDPNLSWESAPCTDTRSWVMCEMEKPCSELVITQPNLDRVWYD